MKMQMTEGYWWPEWMDKRQIDFHLTNMRSLERFLPWCKNRRGVVQAGGSYGLWAKRLASVFNNVWTFEPERDSFTCLVRNVEDCENVVPLCMALGEKGTMVEMKKQGDSSHQIVGFREGRTPCVAVDSFEFVLDALILDVEGAEPQALKSAVRNIGNHHPAIMLEVREEMLKFYGNKLEHLKERLNSLKYVCVDGIGKDFIFVHESNKGTAHPRAWPCKG